MINSEKDVRAYVREASGGRARWVEPALGSTPGLPDCWVPIGKGAQIHFELKVCKLEKGFMCFSVRPEQRKQITAMLNDKVAAGLIVGIEGTNSIAFLAATRESLFGKVLLAGQETPRCWVDADKAKLSGFKRGVNFIFSDLKAKHQKFMACGCVSVLDGL